MSTKIRKVRFEFPEYPTNWQEIIKFIKKRDNYTCQCCYKVFKPNSKWLRVHHIISISKWVRLGLNGSPHDPKNLKTECYSCHREEHPHLRRDSNNKKRRTSFGYGLSRKSSFGYKRKR